MHCYTLCPQPCSRPPPTHASAGDSWTLTGKSGSVSCGATDPFSWVLVHTRFCLCPSRVCFPVLCKSSRLCGGINGDLLQQGLCHTQVYCTQSPWPCGHPLLTGTSTGDTHSSVSVFMGTLEFVLLVKKYFILVFCYIEVRKILLTSCLYLFMTVLGLPWWVWIFWSCSEWGLFPGCGAWASYWSGFAFCRAWALGLIGSVVVADGLSCPVTCGIFVD